MDQHIVKHDRQGIRVMHLLACIAAFGFLLVACGLGRHPYDGEAQPAGALLATPSATVPRGLSNALHLPFLHKVPSATPTPTGTPCDPTALQEPFYGMQFVYTNDLDTAKELGIEVIMTDVRHNGTPASWLSLLDAAHARGIRVIPWLWPEGWTWDGTAWKIDAQARLFLETVAGHPALFAVYALHEPYWNGCYTCGFSTATQQALYRDLKAIADVPLYSEIGSISGWTARGQSTAFADGICDYCGVWYRPFKDGGIYERDELVSHLTANLAVASMRAPNSKVVWLMPAHTYPPDHYRMPTADEMRDLASLVYSRDVAGAWWYPWKFGDLYPDYLSKHPELHPAVRSIYDTYVREAKDRRAAACGTPTSN